MTDFIIVALVVLVVSLSFIAGLVWGHTAEQKITARTLAAIASVDAEAHAAVSRLVGAFPYLQKYL
jgi:phage FluMu protein gp41